MTTGAATTGADTAPLTATALADAWQAAREESADAYVAWAGACCDDRRTAYAVYLAAADREAAAEVGFLSAMPTAHRASDQPHA
jgi:hypothetical protein